jgi:histidinol dehydrogenase
LKRINGFEEARQLLSREAPPLIEEGEAGTRVRQIIDEVMTRGDDALRQYSRQFDGVEPAELEVPAAQLKAAAEELDEELFKALKLAARQITSFHQKQRDAIEASVAAMDGKQLLRPLKRAGVYVPGGSASYPSSVLMTAIPARVAGVKEIIMTTPPGSDGKVPKATLAAASIAGVDRVFAVGGAQAIAAMAFGTETLPRVDKICGPGNIYVTLAKKMVYGTMDIDGLAGPSEVFIVADAKADPSYCAADMLAQAEHDPLSTAILATSSPELADAVTIEVGRRLPDMKRRQIIEKSLNEKGIIAVVADVDEAVRLANLYAPEHLLLLVADAGSYLEKIENAGCVFAGYKATVAIGDYVAGPSHVLPTGGTARFASPLNVNDFIKLTDAVLVDSVLLKKLGAAAATIARAEGLEAHARAVEERLPKKQG